MKGRNLAFIGIFILMCTIGGSMTAAITMEQKKEVISDQQNTDKERIDLEARIKKGIERIDQRMEVLGSKIKNESNEVSADVRQEWNEEMRELEDDRKELNNDLKMVRSDMKEGWNNFKARVNKTLDEVFNDEDEQYD